MYRFFKVYCKTDLSLGFPTRLPTFFFAFLIRRDNNKKSSHFVAPRCVRTEYENLHKGVLYLCVCVMWCVSPACRIPLFCSSSNDFVFNKKVATNETSVEEPTSKGCHNQTLGSTLSLKCHQSLKWFTKI